MSQRPEITASPKPRGAAEPEPASQTELQAEVTLRGVRLWIKTSGSVRVAVSFLINTGGACAVAGVVITAGVLTKAPTDQIMHEAGWYGGVTLAVGAAFTLIEAFRPR